VKTECVICHKQIELPEEVVCCNEPFCTCRGATQVIEPPFCLECWEKHIQNLIIAEECE
jgi:hypothetical protein